MMQTENTKNTGKPEESWWYKRHKRMKELIKEQEEAISKTMYKSTCIAQNS